MRKTIKWLKNRSYDFKNALNCVAPQNELTATTNRGKQVLK